MGKVYVKFSSKVDKPEELISSKGLKIVKQDEFGGFITEAIDSSSADPILSAVELLGVDGVETAEPDLMVPINYTLQVTDGQFPNQWHLFNDGLGTPNIPVSGFFTPGADANVVDAWTQLEDAGKQLGKIIIGVADDSLDPQHPDFAPGQIIQTRNGTDGSTNVGIDQFRNHGTPVSALACAAANGQNVVGVSPGSPLAFYQLPKGISDGVFEDIVDYMIENNVGVWSNSWEIAVRGWAMSTRIFNAIHKAHTEGRNGKGMMVLFSAGNSGYPTREGSLASHPNVMAIGACDSLNKKPQFGSYRNLSVCAPSNGKVGIVTAITKGSIFRKSLMPNNYIGNFGGTSASCPIAAGVAALVLTANNDLTAYEARQIIEGTADKIDSVSIYDSFGYSELYGFGKINAGNAVQAALEFNGDSQTSFHHDTKLPFGATYIRSSGTLEVSNNGNYVLKEVELPKGNWVVSVIQDPEDFSLKTDFLIARAHTEPQYLENFQLQLKDEDFSPFSDKGYIKNLGISNDEKTRFWVMMKPKCKTKYEITFVKGM